MTSFAFFKLPEEHRCTLFLQEEVMPENISSFNELNSKTGFVIAPFCISERTPLVLINPEQKYVYDSLSDVDEKIVKKLNNCALSNAANSPEENLNEDERAKYWKSFNIFHSKLLQGEFRKIVLARHSDVHTPPSDLFGLFKKACREYPRMYVSLFSTPMSGTWFIATPELLLEDNGGIWRTVALAGTMKLRGHEIISDILWNEKNMKEQRIVADYIHECIEKFSDNIQETGPITINSADLVHLKSDFHFSLCKKHILGDLIAELHPTPAVCGMPKNKAEEFILCNEFCIRNYYSGFSGVVNHDTGTHLYVSLRCMQILKNLFRLYAGGGLMPESTESQEWQETEAKLETMIRIIDC